MEEALAMQQALLAEFEASGEQEGVFYVKYGLQKLTSKGDDVSFH